MRPLELGLRRDADDRGAEIDQLHAGRAVGMRVQALVAIVTSAVMAP